MFLTLRLRVQYYFLNSFAWLIFVEWLCGSRTRQARGVAEAEMRQSRAVTGAKSRAVKRREQSRRKTRTDQIRERESSAPAETRRKARAREHEQWQQMPELVRSAIYGLERAQRLPWCCTWRVISTSTPTGAVRGAPLASLGPLTRAAHARDCIRRARVTTPPTTAYNMTHIPGLITEGMSFSWTKMHYIMLKLISISISEPWKFSLGVRVGWARSHWEGHSAESSPKPFVSSKISITFQID